MPARGDKLRQIAQWAREAAKRLTDFADGCEQTAVSVESTESVPIDDVMRYINDRYLDTLKTLGGS